MDEIRDQRFPEILVLELSEDDRELLFSGAVEVTGQRVTLNLEAFTVYGSTVNCRTRYQTIFLRPEVKI